MSVVLRWKAGKYDEAPLMCRIFGHIWSDGWFGYRPYFGQKYYTTDNIGRVHIRVSCRCDRCGQKSEVGMIHHKEDYESA